MPPADQRRPRWPLVVMALLVLAHGAANAVWVSRDETLRANDMGPHLAGALCAVSLVDRDGLSGLLDVARGNDNAVAWPAAAYLPWVPPALLLGRSVPAMRLYNLAFLAIVLVSVYTLGSRFGGPWAGVLAAALLSLYPVVYGESRQFEMDLPGAAMVSLALALLPATARFASPGRAALVGLATAAAVLVRPQSLLIIAPPALLELGLGLLRPAAGRARVLLGAALAATITAGLSAVWWWGRTGVIGEAFFAHQKGHGFAAQGSSLVFYLRALPLATSPLLLAGLVIGVIALASRALRRDPGRPTAALPWAWLLGGLAVLSLLQVHMLRYLLPLLPAAALLTALGLLSLPWRPLRRVLPVLLIVPAVLMGLDRSFALRFAPEPGCAPPARDRIERHEPYVTAGPPAATPLYRALERALDDLRERHDGSGRGVLVRLENHDRLDDLRLRWMGVPLVLAALPGACVTERELGPFILDPGADEVFHWTAVPFPRPQGPVRSCYGLRLTTPPVPPIAPDPALEVLARLPVEDDLSPGAPSELALLHYPRCHEPGREPDRPPM